jgi:hypothetical protein
MSWVSGQAYSDDLRTRVIAYRLHDANASWNPLAGAHDDFVKLGEKYGMQLTPGQWRQVRLIMQVTTLVRQAFGMCSNTVSDASAPRIERLPLSANDPHRSRNVGAHLCRKLCKLSCNQTMSAFPGWRSWRVRRVGETGLTRSRRGSSPRRWLREPGYVKSLVAMGLYHSI